MGRHASGCQGGTGERIGVYAVIETGGKQYRVAVGQQIEVEKLDGQDGDQVAFERVLLVAADGQTTVGTPVVEGARVLATIESSATHAADGQRDHCVMRNP
jgi:ribosomal protein L21